MADLIVTSAVLEDSSTKLIEIKNEFDNAGSRVNERAEVWGQSDVRSAMGEFVGNWKIHRGKISTAVGDLQKKVHDMGEGWKQTEQSIADGLSTSTQ
jgi:hypothetical protein